MTRGRLGESVLEPLLGIAELPILMPSSRAAELLMWRAHRGCSGILHRSVAETVARSKFFAWIVKPKDLAKKICFNCYECRRNRRVLQSQQMAKLKIESSTVCPPWTFISLDYAGPFIIRGEVSKRCRSKCWIIVYVCRSTKAVCLLPTAGYDTGSFLIRHEEFVARHGLPKSIVSDRGSNLVKSGIIVAEKNSPSGWNWDDVVKKNYASTWEFVPVGAQHRNGLAESTVKVMKQSLQHALPAGVILSFAELNTLCARISYAINSRPLGVSNVSHSNQQEDFISVVTPNQLLLGRSGETCSPLEYDERDGRYTRRLAYVSSVYSSWWSRWIKQVLPTLVPIRRWRKAKQNLQIGDIVMIEYPNPLKDDYRVGRIVGTRADSGSFSVLDRRSHLVSSLDNGKRLDSDLSDVTRGEGSVLSTPSGAATVDGTQSFSLGTGTCVGSRDSGFSDTTRSDGSMAPTSSDVGKCGDAMQSVLPYANCDAIDVTKSLLVNTGADGGTMVSGGDVD